MGKNLKTFLKKFSPYTTQWKREERFGKKSENFFVNFSSFTIQRTLEVRLGEKSQNFLGEIFFTLPNGNGSVGFTKIEEIPFPTTHRTREIRLIPNC